MAFTTQTFTFAFLPICFLSYYLISLLQAKGNLADILKKYRVTDLLLLSISLFFYMYACFDDVWRFLIYIVLVYMLGHLIQ